MKQITISSALLICALSVAPAFAEGNAEVSESIKKEATQVITSASAETTTNAAEQKEARGRMVTESVSGSSPIETSRHGRSAMTRERIREDMSSKRSDATK